jgi:hypothetical protein
MLRLQARDPEGGETQTRRKLRCTQSERSLVPVALNAQECDHVMRVLPELLIALPQSAKCTKFVMALVNYLEVASRPNRVAERGANLNAADWAARMRLLWQSYLTEWAKFRPRAKFNARGRKRVRRPEEGGGGRDDDGENDDELDDDVGDDDDADDDADADADDDEPAAAAAAAAEHAALVVTPKMFDESLMADVVLAAGPPCNYSGRVGEQQHQLGKEIAELHSQRRGDVCKTVLKRRSVFEVVGGVQSARAPAAPVDENSLAPFTSDAKAVNWLDAQWLLDDFYIEKALVASGFRLGRRRIYLNDFLHIVKTDGTHVWGRLSSRFILERRAIQIAHERDVPLMGSGSMWLLTMLEFSVERDDDTGSLRAKVFRTARPDEPIAIFASEVALFERRCAIEIEVDDSNGRELRISMRVPPLAATLKPLDQ